MAVLVLDKVAADLILSDLHRFMVIPSENAHRQDIDRQGSEVGSIEDF